MNSQRKTDKGWMLAVAGTVLLASGIAEARVSQDEVHVRNERTTESVSNGAQHAGSTSRAVTVAYGDLDLQGAAGIRTLYSRLQSAARTVCSPAPGRDLAQHRDWAHCYSGALDAAVAETGSSRVSALHGEQTGRPVAARIASAD